MSTRVSQLFVPLSQLIPRRRNPRRVKQARQAHQCLVALIRSQGLLQPLVVRPAEDKPRHYVVIAGKRRLAALFDASTLPEWTVSRDLFSERVLVERKAFMAAQLEALAAERTSLLEDGWKDVIAGRWEEVRDESAAMMTPEQEFDAATTTKLEKIAERYRKWEAKLNETPDDDEAAQATIQEKLQALDEEEWEVIRQAPVFFSEATKAVATVFLMLSPDGQVRREFKVPRTRSKAGTVNRNGHTGEGGDDQTGNRPKPPTSDDLKDGQLAATFTHEAIAVREALLKNDAARRRVLALILHDKVQSEALSVSHDANGTTLHASKSEGFSSAAFDRLKEERAKLDPLAGEYALDDRDAYDRLAELTPAKLDALIDLLVVDCITAHMQRETKLVRHLSAELKINIRDEWRPDAAWLAGYQKIQLSHLMAELRGPVYDPVRETRKKSELVDALATLFTDAAEGRLEDKIMAAKLNGWMPHNLREAA